MRCFLLAIGLICSFRILSCKCADETFLLLPEFDLCKLFPQYEFQMILNIKFCGMCLQMILQNLKKRWHSRNRGDFFSPVVKVNGCKSNLCDKRLESESWCQVSKRIRGSLRKPGKQFLGGFSFLRDVPDSSRDGFIL
jgi:hypothetical protein